ncbi:MAG: hypothetical protein HC867_03020 [Bacteroidia bacterium]|nr:hypothetical protein [Bacteroidia bacterium]
MPDDKPLSQPYWIKDQMLKGSFVVNNQQLIGKPQNGPAYEAVFKTMIEGKEFVFTKPVQYKHTDPVKGELFQPLCIVPPLSIIAQPPLNVFNSGSYKNYYFTRVYRLFIDGRKLPEQDDVPDEIRKLSRGSKYTHVAAFGLTSKDGEKKKENVVAELPVKNHKMKCINLYMKSIMTISLL